MKCAKSDELFDDIEDIKVAGEMLKLAEHILETKRGDFEPESFTDRYEEALVEFLRKKQAHIPVKKSKDVEAPRNVINLMEALRKSVKAEVQTPAKTKADASAKTKTKKRVAGQTELLLPDSGQG